MYMYVRTYMRTEQHGRPWQGGGTPLAWQTYFQANLLQRHSDFLLFYTVLLKSALIFPQPGKISADWEARKNKSRLGNLLLSALKSALIFPEPTCFIVTLFFYHFLYVMFFVYVLFFHLLHRDSDFLPLAFWAHHLKSR